MKIEISEDTFGICLELVWGELTELERQYGNNPQWFKSAGGPAIKKAAKELSKIRDAKNIEEQK